MNTPAKLRQKQLLFWGLIAAALFFQNSAYSAKGANDEQPSGCFIAGMHVAMANGTHKRIEDVRVGDKIVSYNEETHATYTTTVAKAIHHEAKRQTLHHFTLVDGRSFTSNDVQSIYIVEQKAFVNAREVYHLIDTGSPTSVLSQDGHAESISNISLEKKTVPVYNLEVEGLSESNGHSYYVNGILVHNKH